MRSVQGHLSNSRSQKKHGPKCTKEMAKGWEICGVVKLFCSRAGDKQRVKSTSGGLVAKDYLKISGEL